MQAPSGRSLHAYLAQRHCLGCSKVFCMPTLGRHSCAQGVQAIVLLFARVPEDRMEDPQGAVQSCAGCSLSEHRLGCHAHGCHTMEPL